jgi:hypothetical protein
MQLKLVHVKTKVEDGRLTDEYEEQGRQAVVRADRKTDTYTILKAQALKEFFGEEPVDASLYRLRAYNLQYRILQETYDDREDLTLELLRIYPMKTLALEERPADAAFEPYDADKIQLNIVLYKPGLLENGGNLQDYVETCGKKVRVSFDQPFPDFLKMLCEKYGYTAPVVMRRTPMRQDCDVEHYSGEKKLNELSITEGLNLYVEEKLEAPVKDDNSDAMFNSLWEREFQVEKNSIVIRFNKLDVADVDQQPHIYSEAVVIDKRLLVQDLKNKIAEKISESLDHVIFRRGGQHGAELVEDDLTFKLAHFFNMMSLFLERG